MLDIIKTTNNLISKLSKKQQDVLKKRFGLSDGRKRTLEEIGREYGITRERVRQIENDAKKALLKQEEFSFLSPLYDEIEMFIEQKGGFIVEHHILGSDLSRFFGKNTKEKKAETYMYFLLSVNPKFIKHPETPDFHSVWTTKKSTVQLVKKSLEALIKKMESKKNTVSKDELISLLSEYVSHIKDPNALESYICASKSIGSNVYGDYGLKHWPEISTKGVRDKAYLVLKKHGKPMHFRFVVDKINEKFSQNGKKAHPQTVHNELIKDKKFVLVGRGTYALAEWGYKPGTVSDVIKRVLQESGEPMHKEEIIKAVMKERDVKENTVLLNLQNNQNFEKIEDGRYIYKA